MEGVVKGLPVPITLPPLALAYQVNVPVQPNASSVTVPGPQLVPSTAVGVAGMGLTVTVTVVVFLHPLTSVPVTVYVCEAVSVAVTVVPVVADNPVDGLQV